MLLSRHTRRREFITLLGGAAAVWPLAARAQQQAVPVIGFLDLRSPGEAASVAAAFREGLNEVGYVEGQNVAIDYLWAEGQVGRLPALAAELVRRQVAVIFAGSTPSVHAQTQSNDLRAAAGALGRQIHVVNAGNKNDIDAAFATLAERRIGALLVTSIPIFTRRRDYLVALAARHAMPAIYGQREFVAVGGLMSYGTNLADAIAKSASTPAES